MNELNAIENVITSETKKIENGQLTIIRPAGSFTGFSYKQSIATGDHLLLVFYAYKKNGTYDVIYAEMSTEGNITKVFQEQEGILPTLFYAPGGAVWAVLSPHHPDKELEIFLPVYGRSGVTPLKPGKPFPGDFAGVIHDKVICWNEDVFSDKKPDKVQLLHFEQGAVKKKSDFKVEMPKGNKPFVAHEKIHLFSWEDEGLLFRVMDIDGRILSKRSIAFYPEHFQVLSVAPDGAVSLFYTDAGGVLGICDVSADGAVAATPLLTTGLDIFSTWRAVWLDSDTFLITFTHEDGNGWAVIRGKAVAECFVQDKEAGIYKDTVSGKIVYLHDQPLVLWDAVKQAEGRYMLSFYPAMDDDDGKEIILLQR